MPIQDTDVLVVEVADLVDVLTALHDQEPTQHILRPTRADDVGECLVADVGLGVADSAFRVLFRLPMELALPLFRRFFRNYWFTLFLSLGLHGIVWLTLGSADILVRFASSKQNRWEAAYGGYKVRIERRLEAHGDRLPVVVAAKWNG